MHPFTAIASPSWITTVCKPRFRIASAHDSPAATPRLFLMLGGDGFKPASPSARICPISCATIPRTTSKCDPATLCVDAGIWIRSPLPSVFPFQAPQPPSSDLNSKSGEGDSSNTVLVCPEELFHICIASLTARSISGEYPLLLRL